MAMQTLISAKGLRRAARTQELQSHWATLHKPHNAMGRQDSQYGLNGTAGLDEDFFTTGIHGETKGKPLKRVRGGQRKMPVATMTETAPGSGDDQKRSHKPKAVRRIRTLAADSLKAVGIEPEVRANADPVSAAISDDSTSYFQVRCKEAPCTGNAKRPIREGTSAGAHRDKRCRTLPARCLSRHLLGISSELPRRVLSELQQAELRRDPV